MTIFHQVQLTGRFRKILSAVLGLALFLGVHFGFPNTVMASDGWRSERVEIIQESGQGYEIFSRPSNTDICTDIVQNRRYGSGYWDQCNYTGMDNGIHRVRARWVRGTPPQTPQPTPRRQPQLFCTVIPIGDVSVVICP